MFDLSGLFFYFFFFFVVFFFFFQAEDGIRDHCVTGVQTCALPILPIASFESEKIEVKDFGSSHIDGIRINQLLHIV